jgi:hypothetical protein
MNNINYSENSYNVKKMRTCVMPAKFMQLGDEYDAAPVIYFDGNSATKRPRKIKLMRIADT